MKLHVSDATLNRTFNSIKVRLKHCVRGAGRVFGNYFQFHKGAIETIMMDIENIAYENFQFHKGAIETYRIHIPPSTGSLSIP